GFLRAAEAASVALGIKVTPLGVHNANEIERGIAQFALVPNGGLIVAPHPVTRGKLIIDLAAQDRLPAIYPFRFHAKDGGLVSYVCKVAAHGRTVIFPQKDLSDWVAAGGSREALEGLIEAAPNQIKQP